MTGTRGGTGRLPVALDTERDWIACPSCRNLIYRKRFDRLFGVCPSCVSHSRLTVDERLDQLLDQGTMRVVEPAATPVDPLGFTDQKPYVDRLAAARRETGMSDAVKVVTGRLAGQRIVVAAMDFRFLGGSLGTAAGEAVTMAAELALAENVPLLLVTASGGARMQEGLFSLMQMAKTSNAMAALDEAGLLTMTLVTDPTFGGVAASFATLSDVIIAEPGARMGFAGRRVIEQTIREQLPEDFQTAEFLLRRGLIDDVRPRAELPNVLGMLASAGQLDDPDLAEGVTDPLIRDPKLLSTRPVGELLSLARHLDRPTTRDYLTHWADAFVELHGDRSGEDCSSIVGGIAVVEGHHLMVIGHQKGHTTTELVQNNFGMPSPAGYRKAIRLMRLAAKLGLPLVNLIDTPGAHPGRDAEEHGQAHAIAECLHTMGRLPVPVISVVTGEGGSGGALALGVANQVLMTERSIYSVISPEGCAAILWKTADAAHTAAAALRVDARSLLELDVVDGVVPEPQGGAHQDPAAAASLVRDAVLCRLRELSELTGPELIENRRARFRRIGTMNRSLDTKGALA